MRKQSRPVTTPAALTLPHKPHMIAAPIARQLAATLLSNFASGVLNNWLGQISSNVSMSVKYRPNDDLTTQELKVYLGTQLLNNRITIDANAGRVNANQVTGATSTGTQLVGDLNVEYKVTDDGKVRLQAFNRSNDNSMLNANSPYTQGVGVFYREEFETGKELRRHYHDGLSKKTKTPATTAPPADSTKTK